MDNQLLRQAMTNLELQAAEWKQPATGDEVSFLKALKLVKIRVAPIEDIQVVLRYVMVKLGLRADNWPKNEEKTLLFKHIIENYGNHSCEEVRLAFEMAITGKLSISANDVKCYENFSCLYFSQIMNAYRTWAHDTYEQLKPVAKEIEHKPSAEHIAQIEKEYQEYLDKGGKTYEVK